MFKSATGGEELLVPDLPLTPIQPAMLKAMRHSKALCKVPTEDNISPCERILTRQVVFASVRAKYAISLE